MAQNHECSTGNISRVLHAIVIRPAATLGRHPGDDLVWVGDVAGLAMHTVCSIQADALAIGLGGILDHFIDVGRTEILAGVAELF